MAGIDRVTILVALYQSAVLLRSLLARVILAAGNAIILACLASRPEVSYTQWYIQSGYPMPGFSRSRRSSRSDIVNNLIDRKST